MGRQGPILAITATLATLTAAGTVAATAQRAKVSTEEKRKLIVADIYAEPPLTGKLPSSIKWIPDGSGISGFVEEMADTTERTLFVTWEVPSGMRDIVAIMDTIAVPEDLEKGDEDEFSISSYSWMEDGTAIVFLFRGDIFSLDRGNGRLKRLTNTEAKEELVYPSPDCSRLAFVRDSDLFTIDPRSGEETRITSTGCDTIMNGKLDWVYMEELFGRGKRRAYWWSPNGKRIAFLQFREANVPQFPIVSLSDLHGNVEMERYPKAGDANPVVRIGVFDFKRGSTTWLDSLEARDRYISRVNWLEDSHRLAVEILDRTQKNLELLFADVTSGRIEHVLTEHDSAWINVTYMKHFYKGRSLFVWSSERNGFMHLYLYRNNGSLIRQLTRGEWAVADLDGVDEKNGWIYFTALEKSRLERHLYRVSERGTKMKRLTEAAGTHSVTMSRECNYYIDRYSSSDTPPTISVHSSSGKEIFTIGRSDRSRLDSLDVTYPEFGIFQSNEGITYHYSMTKPSAFDPGTKYPVIVYVYGGPHAQVVKNKWSTTLNLWHAMMASRGFVIFSMDNRGSYGRGKLWEGAVSRKLGSVELSDQLAGVEFLRSLPYVDTSRIGIWGWSYGGFMTCTALLKAPGIFKAGAAVAPVTDWRLYDSIYTERYMGKPDENEEGYENSSLLTCADSLEAAFLLVHGTTDDNVHMQNSMQLVDRLIKAGKHFDLMLYPDKEHSIKGKAARIHLFEELARFFEENLGD